MTSLADELDLDPAFDDVNFSNGGGVALSLEDEQGGYESVEEVPRKARVGRRGRGAVRRDSDEIDAQETSLVGGSSEGFSLADELGGGNDQGKLPIVSSLAEEFGDQSDAIAEDSSARAEGMDDETKARRDQEHYLVSSETLNDSLRLTETFLSELKKASATSNTAAGSNLSMPPASSHSSIHGLGGSASDDTSTLEGRAGNVLKQMREYSSAREDQIRELQECDRLLRRAFEEGGEWISALANVDDFEGEASKDSSVKVKEDDDLSFISNVHLYKHQRMREGSTTTSTDVVGVRGGILHEEEDGPSPSSYDRSPHSTISINNQQTGSTQSAKDPPKLSVCQQLASIQSSTSDLVLSLGSIHEQSQVARASMNDAARRIRSIKTVLTNWSTEIEAVEQSRLYISSWEASRGSETRPKDIQEWTKSHLDKFQRVLNDADVKARELLSPIHDPVLDRLAAST